MSKLIDVFPRVKSYILSDGEVIRVDIYKEERKIEATAKFSKIIPFSKYSLLKDALCKEYNLKGFDLIPLYDKSLLSADAITETAKFTPSSLSTFLNSAEILFNENCVILKTESMFSEEEIKRSLKELVKNHFDTDLEVSYECVKSDDEIISDYETKKQEISKKIDEEHEAERNAYTSIIFGNEIKGKATPISEISEISGRVIIEGELFKKEPDVRETRDGRFIVLFGVTDNETSINCKLFLNNKNAFEKVEGRLKKGTAVRVKGDAEYDKYARELLIKAFDVNEYEKEERMDNAEEKRVELHLHTQLSAMDALTNVSDLIKRAVKWGHNALAITDHGVVQAFPFALKEIPKGVDLKLLYGVEAYLVDIGRPFVLNSRGQDIDCETVVFDIETTGVDNIKDKITEIGAVKIKDGVITDRLSTFINPGMPIPPKIVEITNITDDMVKDAPSIEEFFPEFIKFCEGCVLVAHNAAFDTGFMKQVAKSMEIDFHPTYIDTLELARSFLPDLPKHKLEFVTKALNISLEGQHRAVNDSEATAHIYLEFVKRFKEMGITNLEDANTAFDDEKDPKKKSYHHAVIFAKNYYGLQNLYRIISASNLQYFHKRPRVPKFLLFKYYDDLIMGSACEQGELYRAFLHGKDKKEINRIARLYDYFEIQPLGNNEFLVRQGEYVKSKEDLIRINKEIIKLGEFYHKPVVATCDVHFLDPHHAKFRAILQAGQGYTDADNQAPLFFRTTEEMLKEFAYLGKEKAYEVVVTNTNKVADMIDKFPLLPKGPNPPVMEEAPDEITRMCYEKAHRIYGEVLPDIVNDRIDKELGSIIKHGYAVLYYIAHKLVKKSNDDGYLVGSRGSVGSSFIAFLSDITEVNALPPHYVCPNCKNSEFITDGSVGCGADMEDKTCPKCGAMYKKDGFDIPFETFLGFNADKEPDIDLNFSGMYQAQAHKYTEVLFGEGHTFKAGTVSGLQDKTAYGFVKKYLDERNLVVSNAEIDRLVSGCTGVKRTSGQHPGGIIIVPRDNDIHEFCPVQHPADKTDSDIITTHFDFHSLDKNLLKLDILGHDDPSVIRMLEDLTGVDVKTVPLDDKETMSLFLNPQALGVTEEQINSKVGTFGVPEFGTSFVRQMLVDTKPTTLSELIRISGLSHGTDVWLGNAQELIQQGVATLKEAVCCRDDIMVYLIYCGLPKGDAFTIMEHVRKGKGVTEEEEALMKDHNVPDWYIESCKKIKYMFPKAHAAAYVMMGFRIAYFKVHYPKEYYTAYFSIRADIFDALTMCGGYEETMRQKSMIEAKGNDATAREKDLITILELVCEMNARGINFVPIDIYKCDATMFKLTPEGIMPPLSSIPGLGDTVAKTFVEEREKEPFATQTEMRQRGKLSQTLVETMAQMGILGDIPESNQISFGF